jgi:HAD superfamily hydrolase (TIGR01490 family)
MTDTDVSRYHIFDVDKTIMPGSTVKTVLLEGFKRRLIPWAIAFYVPYFFILFSFYEIRHEHFDRVFRPLRGIPEEALRRLAEEILERDFRHRLFPEMVNKIRNLHAGGAEVIIASSSFKFILDPLAALLEVDRVICSEIEMVDGTTTGRIKGIPAFQRGKERRVREYFESRGIDLGACTFYTDSHRDLSLLRAVGRPVAVNPDRKLSGVALREGWPVIRPRHNLKGGRK